MLFELCISKQAEVWQPCAVQAKGWVACPALGTMEEEEGGWFLKRAGRGEHVTLPEAETGEVKRLQ